jgi:DnaK suppressor protein
MYVKLQDELRKLKSQDMSCEIDGDGDETDLVQGNCIAGIGNILNKRIAYKINSINIALKKIEDGTYGICEDCDENINEKRLEYNPHFVVCISCAEAREKS